MDEQKMTDPPGGADARDCVPRLVRCADNVWRVLLPAAIVGAIIYGITGLPFFSYCAGLSAVYFGMGLLRANDAPNKQIAENE